MELCHSLEGFRQRCRIQAVGKNRKNDKHVIMGHLIPAGTGIPELRRLKVVKKGVVAEEKISQDEVQTDKLATAKAMLSLD